MWYFLQKVDLFEDYFQFDQLDYLVYRRFLELLRTDIWWHFHSANKKHYKDCITSRGIDMDAHKRPGAELLKLTPVGAFINFATAEDYRRLEQKYSKFWPYFKFNELSIYFNTWDGKTIDRGPIPVPKVYRRLSARNIKQTTDIDYVVKEAVHPGVQKIIFELGVMELDAVTKLVNYTLTKIQGLSEYYFDFYTVNIPEERVRQLIKLPPTTRKMTLDVGSRSVWYHQREDL